MARVMSIAVLSCSAAALLLRSLRPRKTRIHLIRHGQSTFNKAMDQYFETHPDELAKQNAAPNDWWNDPTHWDPPGTTDAALTPLGVEQAARLPQLVAALPVELICVSPLTRALHTCALAFGLHDGGFPPAPVMVLPLAAERVNSSCDVGQSSSVLRNSFGNCPAFSFDQKTLTEDWWKQGLQHIDPPRVMEHLENEFVPRINKLKEWLKARPESDICLVCHTVVINQFTGTWVENCAVITVEL